MQIGNPFIGVRLKATSREPSSIRFHMFCPGGTVPLNPPAGLAFDAGNILPHSNTEGKPNPVKLMMGPCASD